MPTHKQLEALIRAAARYFHVSEDQLRAPGGRYHPLACFRQVTQLVALDRGHKLYQIAKAFDYVNAEGSLVNRNAHKARCHISKGHAWWSETRVALAKAWDEELDG